MDIENKGGLKCANEGLLAEEAKEIDVFVAHGWRVRVKKVHINHKQHYIDAPQNFRVDSILTEVVSYRFSSDYLHLLVRISPLHFPHYRPFSQ